MIDDAHLAHGLAGDQLEPDWPPLTEEEVVAVLARLPSLGSLHAIDWRSPRPLSAAALVTTTTGRAFIKRHHRSVRDERTLAEEHRFSDAVRALGVPVPRILRAAGGESVIGTEQWVYEVQESARGTDVYREAYSWSPIGGERHALEAGAMLARLHHAAASFDAPQRSTDILVARADLLSSDDPLAAIAAQWSVRPALARYLADRDWQHEVGTAIAPWHVRAAEASRGLMSDADIACIVREAGLPRGFDRLSRAAGLERLAAYGPTPGMLGQDDDYLRRHGAGAEVMAHHRFTV